jgi:solute carrier family 6 GABA transporter-like protein 1
MFACGIPIFFQEVAAGQYLGTGGLNMIGQLVPMLQGESIPTGDRIVSTGAISP